MSRPGNPSAFRKEPFLAYALLILTICLVLYFLAEDARFYSASESLAESTSTNPISFDQVDHQDDLVMLSDLPEYLPDLQRPVVLLWIYQSEQQAHFPILTPPKIS